MLEKWTRPTECDARSEQQPPPTAADCVPSESAPAAPSAAPPIDVPAALNNLGGDRELLLEVVAAFCETLQTQLAGLEEASAQADLARLRAIAHSLRGSASNICAESTSRIARRLEQLAPSEVTQAAALLSELKVHTDQLREFASALMVKQ